MNGWLEKIAAMQTPQLVQLVQIGYATAES
jgi:hypothetical protein